ncbi:hypothetical protein [Corynebacterium aquilae]|uniref:Uncharacterized protein n=1 Tax=Corynebacterium aquilae DSM 44791 TaxID=1431546 RepID=A0A1L7CHK2_9CORY|nr:hypothetical protein [Corynebacterium aquilae]APT85340.1 hypothetical protein CAQU_10035 [Corynebacterium aquilae DSM 44791]
MNWYLIEDLLGDNKTTCRGADFREATKEWFPADNEEVRDVVDCVAESLESGDLAPALNEWESYLGIRITPIEK